MKPTNSWINTHIERVDLIIDGLFFCPTSFKKLVGFRMVSGLFVFALSFPLLWGIGLFNL